MTVKEIKKAIVIQESPCGDPAFKRLTGKFELWNEVVFDPNYSDCREYAKEAVRDNMIRSLFQDRRHQLAKSLADLARESKAWGATQELIDRVMEAAKYQPRGD